MTVVRADEVTRARSPRVSTFTLKVIMALTGAVFVAFVVVHMVGNLKVYSGADAFNTYAQWLREVGYPLVPKEGVLWALRVVLLGSLVAHVGAALVLWTRGRAARGRFRRRRLTTASAWVTRTMMLGGLFILGFLLVHLLDLTIGRLLSPGSFQAPDADGTIHAYANLVASFSRPWIATGYVAWMLVIGVHIWQGWRMIAQDAGITGHRLRVAWGSLAALLALAIVIGNATIPLLVLLGVIR